MNPVRESEESDGDGFRLNLASRFFKNAPSYNDSQQKSRLGTLHSPRRRAGCTLQWLYGPGAASPLLPTHSPSRRLRPETARLGCTGRPLCWSETASVRQRTRWPASLETGTGTRPAWCPASDVSSLRHRQRTSREAPLSLLLLFIKILTAFSSSPEKYAQLAAFVLSSSSMDLKRISPEVPLTRKGTHLFTFPASISPHTARIIFR